MSDNTATMKLKLSAPAGDARPGRAKKVSSKRKQPEEPPKWLVEQERRQIEKNAIIKYETEMGDELPWNKRRCWQEVGSMAQSWPASGSVMAPVQLGESPLIRDGDSYVPGGLYLMGSVDPPPPRQQKV
jgi:hypothetical protein